MDRSRSSFTVLFQDPFWVGVAERWDGAGYRAEHDPCQALSQFGNRLLAERG